jgi:predicted exporter
MSRSHQFRLFVWLACMALAALLIWRAPFRADMSMFLPEKPSAQQRLLLNNLAAGSAGRMLLVGVEGVAENKRGEFSTRFSEALSQNTAVARVNNGSPESSRADQEFVFRHRYLLSNRLSEASFTPAGLRSAIDNSVQEIASSAGMLTKNLLTSDPTGETLALVGQLSGAGNITIHDGVWTSTDGKRLLFVCYTKAGGADLDGQESALEAIRTTFADTKTQVTQANAKLFLTGPGVFATESRDAIRSDVSRLSTLGTVLILIALFIALRSLRLISVGIVPMLSSVLVATATIAVMYGSVHGMVLGFGTTLIGEAVDYALYYLVRSKQPNTSASHFWRAIRLGMTISVIGFGALFLSGFPGLKQLAVFSIAGLLTAVLVTRFVLPIITGPHHQGASFDRLDARLHAWSSRARRWRWLTLLPVCIAATVIWQHREHLWSSNLSSLNPVSAGAQKLDEELRAATGSPDVRLLVAVQGADEQAVLQAFERLTPRLNKLVSQGVIAGFESPAQWLPSKAEQARRRALLPSAAVLRERLGTALQPSAQGAPAPMRADRLEPFVLAIEQTAQLPDITRASLAKSQLGLLIESLMYESPDHATPADQRYNGLISLRLPSGQAANAQLVSTLQTELSQAQPLYVLDLMSEANAMYASYLGESFRVAGYGGLGIALLLLLTTRSLWSTARILWPLLIALSLVVGLFAWRGIPLSLLHLIGLFLMIAVGSNYSLFAWMATATADSEAPSTPSAQLLACMTTVIGFGVLSFSQVPLLSALGSTVGLGAGLSLLFSWIWLGTRRA